MKLYHGSDAGGLQTLPDVYEWLLREEADGRLDAFLARFPKAKVIEPIIETEAH